MGTRRGFLQVAGLAALGVVVAKPAIDLFNRLNSNDSEVDTEASGAVAGALPESKTTRRLAMVIDILKCNEYKKENGGCTLCEVACHTWHKVPDISDHEEELKWIWDDKYGKVFEENLIPHVDEENEEKKARLVKLLCNQCEHPPCIKYCPTRATWKRPDGIIIVDEHRCIGCRYCMAGCPYGARSFNWRRPRKYVNTKNGFWRLPQPENGWEEAGIDLNAAKLNSDYPNRTRGVVEKCNFCADILEIDADGNPTSDHTPKCVIACPAKALIFGDLMIEHSEVNELLKSKDANILRRMPDLGTYPNNYYLTD